VFDAEGSLSRPEIWFVAVRKRPIALLHVSKWKEAVQAMFLAGLKFALGVMTGAGLCSGGLLFLIMSLHWVGNCWRRVRRVERAIAEAQRSAIFQTSGFGVLRHSMRTDEWNEKPHRTEYIQ
jgi:hypothetical protein